MIPKPLYEALPYAYFLIGSGLWLVGSSALEILGGMLLYCASAQQWVLRSNYRRGDRARANIVSRRHGSSMRPDYRHHVLPRGLYEALPFGYIAIGYVISNVTRFAQGANAVTLHTNIALLSAILFALTGLIVLMLRGQNRHALTAASA